MKTKKMIYTVTAVFMLMSFAINGYSAYYEWPNVGLDTSNTQTVLYGAKKEEAVYFNSADLEFKLGLHEGELVSITVLSLPKAEEGKLTIGKTDVKPNDCITRTQINELAFVPAKDAAKAEFTLLPEAADSVKTTLSINLYEKDNLAPVIESGKFSTNKNMPIQGTLSVYDPDGDMVMIKILEAPSKGDIQFNGTSFTYEPYLDITGADTMSFVCVDKQGNYSKKGIINFNIEKDRSAFSYADMQNNPSHYSAAKLHEKGILTGEKSGDTYFFYPSEQVTRGKFIIKLIAALGLENRLSSCVNCGLQNDSEIPQYMKAYVKVAKETKIITEKVFYPNQVLTRAEAVVLIDRALDIPDVKNAALSYSDKADIPKWAIQSYMNLSAYKMLDFYDGLMKPTTALQNDHMADLLWQVWKYTDSVRK